MIVCIVCRLLESICREYDNKLLQRKLQLLPDGDLKQSVTVYACAGVTAQTYMVRFVIS